MVAQITPGELVGVYHALEFAKDLVVEWLRNYKFRKWTATETRKITVTDEMKQKRAKEIAEKLSDHSRWRSHGRSIKIEDLESIGLKITRVDNFPELADIVYRIQIVCRFLFESTTAFKIFATQDNKIFRHGVTLGAPIKIPQIQAPDVTEVQMNCPQCGAVHRIYAKLIPEPRIDVDYKSKGFIPFPKESKIICACGFELDLSGIKNQIELQTGRRIVTESNDVEGHGNKAE
jgi:hypothetical protein